MSENKEHESQNVNVDAGSPKIENLVEAIEQPPVLQPQQHPAIRTYQRGFQNGSVYNKRPKLENTSDEYESNDGATSHRYVIADVQHHDDCELFGRSIAAQLRQMARPQKLLAQRLISEICFRGQIQALQIATALVNQSTNTHQPMPQPVLPNYPCRPVAFNNSRGSEYMLTHSQQNIRHQGFVPPVNLGSMAPTYQNYLNPQQPPEHITTGLMNNNSINQSDA